MTTQPQLAPLAPVAPAAPSWALYVYDGVAHLAYRGRVVATASVATPARQARIEAMVQRLTECQEASGA